MQPPYVLFQEQRHAKDAAWRFNDPLPAEAGLDFARPFLPDALARTAGEPLLTPLEALRLNQIRGHAYLGVLDLLEGAVLPLPEAKDREAFKRFRTCFAAGIGAECQVIGSAQDFRREILAYPSLSVALLAIHLEWMAQRHGLGGVQRNPELEPRFEELLRCHRTERAPRASLDGNGVVERASGLDRAARRAAVEGYLDIATFLDDALRRQVELDLDALERVAGRALPTRERQVLINHQHQASRWTFIGAGMSHPEVLKVLSAVDPEARERVMRVAPLFY